MDTWIHRTPFAHRGLHGGGVPENSMTAILSALEHGYGIEVDLRLSADGVPVVFHDVTLERMAGDPQRLDALPAEELTSTTLADTRESIPELGQVLDAVDGDVPLLLEVKNTGAPGRLESAVADHLEGYSGAVAVQSFNPRSLAWFRKHAPAYPRGQIAGSFQGVPLAAWKRVVLERLMLTAMSRPQFIAYEHAHLPYWPVTLHKRMGLPVLAWTVTSHEAEARVAGYADNIIFEGYRP